MKRTNAFLEPAPGAPVAFVFDGRTYKVLSVAVVDDGKTATVRCVDGAGVVDFTADLGEVEITWGRA